MTSLHQSLVDDFWAFMFADSLEMGYPDVVPRRHCLPMSMFLGENVSFQIAIRPSLVRIFRPTSELTISVGGVLGAKVTIHQLELVPCALAAFPDHDGGIKPLIGGWTSAWIDVTVDDAELTGRHAVPVQVVTAAGEVLFDGSATVTVLGQRLPELGIVISHWFHCDGLASYYGVEVFSEEHGGIIEKFVVSAADMGVNSLLPSIWTPPLDTAVGGLRLTTQLIGITDDGGQYRFDFSLLERWLGICALHGIKYLEIAHLFTQWGARFTPAIYVSTDVGSERRFGWDVPATDPSYRRLMATLLPELRSVLARHWPRTGPWIGCSSTSPTNPTERQCWQATWLPKLSWQTCSRGWMWWTRSATMPSTPAVR